MRLLTLIFALAFCSYGSAGTGVCAAAFGSYQFSKSAAFSRGKTLEGYKERIDRFFNDSPGSPRRLSDKDDAYAFLRALEKNGSPLDLQIAGTYISVRELLRDDPLYHEFAGSYEDPLIRLRRQAPRFQEQHWSWKGIEEYLFDSPSVLTFVKQDDMTYLRHVLKTARTMKRESAPLYYGNLLGAANESWVLERLQTAPDVRESYLAYQNAESVQKVWARFATKFYSWMYEPTIRSKREARAALAERTIAALRTSNMAFDTYILEQYFDLTRAFRIESPKVIRKTESGEILSNWNSFDNGLAQGSLSFVTDFLFQNSHDIDMKVHLARILKEMDQMITETPSAVEGAESKSAQRFAAIFTESKRRIEARLPRLEAPENYQTDLQIYTSQYRPGDSTGPIRMDRIIVRWNSIIGKLQANVTFADERRGRAQTVSDILELRNYVHDYFENFRRSGTYSEAETSHDEQAELNAPLANTTFITFTKPGTSEIVGIIRIFDGNNGQPIFIETEFPHLVLPEREQKKPIFELGRLMTTADAAGISMPILLSRVAEFFVNTNASGVVYVDGNRAAKIYYQRAGAQIAYEPKDLKLSANATPLWILKIPIDELAKRFTRANFESLRLKPNVASSQVPLNEVSPVPTKQPWWKLQFLRR